jgi:SAM-dependent methyltransferase
MEQKPFNQQESVFADPVGTARYEKQIFDSWVRQLDRWVGRSTGLDILELGPGIALATQIMLADRGNRITVLDRYPPRWHSKFHPLVYAHLAEMVGGSAELERSASAAGFEDICVRQVAEPAEDMRSLRNKEFDVVLSNAVLEHVADLDRVCLEMARITKIGGVNIHQIDLGYHKNRERPLDHLLMSESEFYREASAAQFEHGNRWRASEIIARFERAGLTIKHVHVSQKADPIYLAEVREKIRLSGRRYGLWPAEDMAVLSFLLVAWRPPIGRGMSQSIKGHVNVVAQCSRKFLATVLPRALWGLTSRNRVA